MYNVLNYAVQDVTLMEWIIFSQITHSWKYAKSTVLETFNCGVFIHIYKLLISLFSTVFLYDNMPSADTSPILPGRPYISM